MQWRGYWSWTGTAYTKSSLKEPEATTEPSMKIDGLTKKGRNAMSHSYWRLNNDDRKENTFIHACAHTHALTHTILEDKCNLWVNYKYYLEQFPPEYSFLWLNALLSLLTSLNPSPELSSKFHTHYQYETCSCLQSGS